MWLESSVEILEFAEVCDCAEMVDEEFIDTTEIRKVSPQEEI